MPNSPVRASLRITSTPQLPAPQFRRPPCSQCAKWQLEQLLLQGLPLSSCPSASHFKSSLDGDAPIVGFESAGRHRMVHDDGLSWSSRVLLLPLCCSAQAIFARRNARNAFNIHLLYGPKFFQNLAHTCQQSFRDATRLHDGKRMCPILFTCSPLRRRLLRARSVPIKGRQAWHRNSLVPCGTSCVVRIC